MKEDTRWGTSFSVRVDRYECDGLDGFCWMGDGERGSVVDVEKTTKHIVK